MKADLLAALEPVVDTFQSLGVPYLIGGSVASSALGVGRSTLDVDLVADLRAEHIDGLVARLRGSYYIDGDLILDAIRRGSSFNVIHLESMLKVDVFVLADRPFDRTAFGRRTPRPLAEQPGAREFPISSAEDIVLHKLEWFRKGGEVSDRQWSDCLGVLRVSGARMDHAYLERWATDLDVADLLARALCEAGE